MPVTSGEIIADALHQPAPAISYAVSRSLRELFPGLGIVTGSMESFNLEAYAAEGLCEAVERPNPYPERLTYLAGPDNERVTRPSQMLFDVTWDDHHLIVLIMHFPDHQGIYHYWILADTVEIADAFHTAVCVWNSRAPEEYILVFDVNGWNRDEALLAAIAGATLDNLVLRGTMKEEILADIQDFFASEETYTRYGVPWKRGILFLGPPGNGKTHAVKALVNAIGQRCVYVKTFRGGMPDIFGIRGVFDQARRIAPCILVLEDLDSLLTPDNRSYFLNELDGFAGNHGILTLATTNHPERLDPAILDRPSRFDRKYSFDLPQLEERKVYIQQWNRSLEPELRLTPAGVTAVAEDSESFSFAYLKELFLAATMRWIREQVPGSMDAIMLEQMRTLREQMETVDEVVAEYPPVMHYGRRGPRHGGVVVPHNSPDDVPL
ncbi:MAG TPA: ATP-binding protein [Chloroflexota bacterium]|nr:ATP-binding protein [Chloroflexota bacterium]